MTDYLKCLAAYLTGWVIAQGVFNRVRHYVWDRDGYDVKDEIASYVAERLTERLDSRDKEREYLRGVCQAAQELLCAKGSSKREGAMMQLHYMVQRAQAGMGAPGHGG